MNRLTYNIEKIIKRVKKDLNDPEYTSILIYNTIMTPFPHGTDRLVVCMTMSVYMLCCIKLWRDLGPLVNAGHKR